MMLDTHLYLDALKDVKSAAEQYCTEIEAESGRAFSTQSRIKSAASIEKKLEKLELEITEENAVRHIKDIAGLRIVCTDLYDVYLAAEKLLYGKRFAVLDIKDYIQNPKSNGYRSLHLILGVRVVRSGREQVLPVEVQIRTVYMNIWAEVEHKLCYKPKRKPAKIVKLGLKYMAGYIAELEAGSPETGVQETFALKRLKRIAHIVGA